MKSLIIVSIILFPFFWADAQESDNDLPMDFGKFPSTVSLLFDSDSSDTRGTTLILDYYLESNWHIYFSGGTAKDKSKSGTTEDIVTTTIGFGSNPQDDFNFLVLLENYGAKDSLQIASLRAPLTWILGNWSLTFTPIARKVGITYTNPFTLDKADGAFGSGGLGFKVIYGGFKNWSLGLDSISYSYQKKVSDLQNAEILLSDTSFALASGLVDRTTSLFADYSFEHFTVGVNLGSSASAYDDTKTGSFTLNFLVYLTSAWELELAFGTSETPDSDSAGTEEFNYNTLGVSYSW